MVDASRAMVSQSAALTVPISIAGCRRGAQSLEQLMRFASQSLCLSG
jgi:hypothetical protein